MALFFFGPVFHFHSPYAAVGGMTIGYGLQYLLLVGLVAAGRGRGSGRAIGLALLLNLGLLGGLLLSVAPTCTMRRRSVEQSSAPISAW
jgi:hypothetical protein